MKRRLLAFVFVLVLVFSLSISASAQSYYFALEEETVHVYWNSDGTLSIDYQFTFRNEPGAHVIDFVDVGMPNSSYDFNSINADVDGYPVSISTDFQGEGSSGFSVDMGMYAIQPGQRGTVHVYVGNVRRMIYLDDNEPDTYASSEFSPTWFGSSFVSGSTDLTVVFHLPPGVQPEEPRYHIPRGGWPGAEQPEAAFDNEGRITYTWHSTSANAYTQYFFGISFPKQYIPAEAIVTAPAFSIDFEQVASFCCFGGFILLFVGLPILGVINERKRKLKYLPPKISIEGHGIKRGLTAVEAAILLEQPLDKAMTMILFGVVKKNAATVLNRDPLRLQVTDPLPEDLHEYEQKFLEAFKEESVADRRKSLQEMTISLVKSVSEKMKGFSRKETTDYYKSIMERAWKQIEAADTPEVKSQLYEETLEWTMLDREYDDRTRRVFTGPVFIPQWWHNYDPTYRPVTTGSPKTASVKPVSSTGRASLPSIPGSTFAASVVTGVQNFSSKVIGDVSKFTSNVTQKTNPAPIRSTTKSGGWSSGGGSSCACACACAGCACACAGGGR